MARKIRVDYSGPIYHVLNRGDRREPIFQDGLDRHRFLETLGQACAKTSWAVHAADRGWCLGDEESRQELLARMEPKMGPHHGGAEGQDSAQAQAERLLEGELRRHGWTSAQLKMRRKVDAQKVRIARRLREETTMTLGWIAEELKLGSAGYAAHCLRKTTGSKYVQMRD